MKIKPISFKITCLFITVFFITVSNNVYGQSYLPLTGGTLTGTLWVNPGSAIFAPYFGMDAASSPPPSSSVVGSFSNSSSLTLELVGYSNGWRFIPYNTSNYSAPVATIDNSGNTAITGTLIAKSASIASAGAPSLVIIGSQSTGKTMLQLATSSDAGGYGFIQSISAQGVAYGNTVINPTAGNVLIGKTSQGNNTYMLDVAGSVRSNAVVVNSSGSDFVFEPKYKLPKLSFLEKYINQNHHLPEIPSAKQMQANGLDVGKNETKLLQKVEELTLYLIEKDEQINKEATEINDQKIINNQIAEQLKLQQEEITQLKKQLKSLINTKSK